eukprot:TRINITY_DN4773_c0_g1_i1.p1 TRINITY_DN4773_c0_g1~~TRINITY_DN4773_c0_g1_i1.p1  ORF type:complete len:971 (+),score=330.09 TRINITY_DN4773_c0_g1_i1:186-3098(+)
MEGEETYDEFGNIFGESSEGESSGSESEEIDWAENADSGIDTESEDDDENEMEDEGLGKEIVQHEDKEYYEDAQTRFGQDVDIQFQDEDAMEITEPVVKSGGVKRFSSEEATTPELKTDIDFIVNLLNTPALCRNVAIIGDLEHGKTGLVDMMVQETQVRQWPISKEMRYADSSKLEQERGLSIRSTLLTMCLSDLRNKSHLLNVIDVPGHPGFADEMTVGIRSCDGAVVVVDVVDGIRGNAERQLHEIVSLGLPVVVVLSKIDRLFGELKLPPEDAYHKIRYVLDQINAHLQSIHGYNAGRISPEKGNVVFASSKYKFMFSLESLARKKFKNNWEKFVGKMWGNYFINSEKRIIKSSKRLEGLQRTFVTLVLEPIYKAFTCFVGEVPEVVNRFMRSHGHSMKRKELNSDVNDLIPTCFKKLYGTSAPLVDMILKKLPSPKEGILNKIQNHWTGDMNASEVTSMMAQDIEGPVVANVVKLYQNPMEPDSFLALTRVMSGTIKKGMPVQVLGESFTPEEGEDIDRATVKSIWLCGGRYRVEMDSAPCGSLVLLEGVHKSISKSATIVDLNSNIEAIFQPLRFITKPTVKLSVEPLNPSELPKLIEALRRLHRTFPCLKIREEESGEQVILGTSEIQLDCALHELREVHTNIEVKVADPMIALCETVSETSFMRSFSETANKKNKFTLIAEQLDQGLGEQIERGEVNDTWSSKKLGDFFTEGYNWDKLAARNVWAFGPTSRGANVLINDTLPSEVDRKTLGAARGSIEHGFRWACREGPLCEESVRNVKIKILDATIDANPTHHAPGQIIPTTRRAVFSSILMAKPKLMEPWYAVDIQAPPDCIKACYAVLQKRRGHVSQDDPVPGTPWYRIRGYLPVLDSFGFETDLRVHTQGQAFPLQMFDHWGICPGDPLDKSIVLRPLEESAPPHLARDLMVKTRRRKGLSEDVEFSKFIDDEVLNEMAVQEMLHQNY